MRILNQAMMDGDNQNVWLRESELRKQSRATEGMVRAENI